MTTLYDILQVSPRADPSVIESAYRSLVAKYEPQAATSYEAAQQLRHVNEAYQVLSDPARRTQYDQALQGQVTPPPVTPEFAYAPTQPAPATVPTPLPAKRSGAPMWLLGILALCLLVAVGLVCLGGAFVLTSGGGGLAGLLVPATPQLVVATTVVQQPTLAPTATPSPAMVPAATVPPSTNGGSVITAAVMAADVQGDNFTPVGVTDSFPANQSVFHAIVTVDNAPAGTAVKAVWLTAAGSSMGQYELQTQGSRNLDFTFKPNGGSLPAGQYQVQILLNGSVDRTLNFSVAGGSSGSAPSDVISSVTMAQDTQGTNKDPINPTTTFTPNSIFHAVVATKDAPANTKFTATWYAVDVGSAAAPNTKIDSSSLTTDGTRNLDFTLSPKSTWPPGTYRVEIYVNDQLAKTINFSVQ